MNPDRIDAVLFVLKREELRDAYWFVDVCVRFGTMNEAEADRWRKRILARQLFLELEAGEGPVS